MRVLVIAVAVGLASACGHSYERVETVARGEPQRHVSYMTLASPGPPPAVQVTLPEPAPLAQVETASSDELRCAGDRRVRVVNRRIAGVIATGRCVVEIHESIVAGEPALHVDEDARVIVTESRIIGAITGTGHVEMRGSTHETPNG